MVTHVDLAALPRFADDLDDLVVALRVHRAETEAALRDINRVWRDATYLEHRARVLSMNERIEAFETDCLRMIDFLGRKHTAGMRVLNGG